MRRGGGYRLNMAGEFNGEDQRTDEPREEARWQEPLLEIGVFEKRRGIFLKAGGLGRRI